ncbi:phage tail protein [Vibrio vulnificus]|uniref:phage tail-collar fiber domain-containing protein n=1 Tax=Vibrio vulnificus TaxID=672 RepID=UPI003D9C83A1
MNELINRGVILTTRGQQLIEDAKATGRDIQLKKFGVGDGGGDAFNPTLDELKALTALPGEWDKRNLNSVEPIESGGYTVEGLVPSDVGEGLWVRIFGIYTIDDQLMYVFLYPSWQKPQNNGNLLIELPFKATIGISDAPDFNLVIDPSLVAATQQFVLEQDRKHTAANHPHEQYQLSALSMVLDNSVLKKNQRNLFMTFASSKLPTAENHDWLLLRVAKNVDLRNGDCRALTPDGEVIHISGQEATSLRITETERDFLLVRIEGAWHVC